MYENEEFSSDEVLDNEAPEVAVEDSVLDPLPVPVADAEEDGAEDSEGVVWKREGNGRLYR